MTENTTPAPAKEPSGAAKMFGDFAPALVGFTDNTLFGQVWTTAQESSPRPHRAFFPAAEDPAQTTGSGRPGGCDRLEEPPVLEPIVAIKARNQQGHSYCVFDRRNTTRGDTHAKTALHGQRLIIFSSGFW